MVMGMSTEDGGNDVINDDVIAHNSVHNSSVTNGDVITNSKEEVSNDKVESKNGDSSLPIDNVDNESIA